MRVLVTGAGGCLGSYVACELARSGYEVHAIVRSPERASFLNQPHIRLFRGELGMVQGLAEALDGVEAVVHAAALGSRQGTLPQLLETNVEGTRWLIQQVLSARLSKVVHISSTSVVKTTINRPISECAETIPTHRHRWTWSDLTTDWRYARSKALAEEVAFDLAAQHHLDLCALRFGPLFGVRDGKASLRLMTQLQTKRHLVVPTVQVPWLYAGEAAKAVRLALESSQTRGQAFHLAGESVSQYAFMQHLRAQIAAQRPQRLAKVWPLYVPLGVHYDTQKASALLGFKPASFEDGLKEMVRDWVA